MKTISFLNLLFISALAFSQPSEKELKKHFEKVAKSKEKGTVILSLDTIFNKGIPYAVMKTQRSGFVKNYTVLSLKGEELIYVKTESYETPNTNRVNQYDAATVSHSYFRFNFLQSKNVAEMEAAGWKDNMEKLIVENNLVENGEKINETAESKFVMVYPPTISGKVSGSNNGSATVVVANYNLVERNRNAEIFVMGNDIKQDFKVIGTSQKTQQAANGTIVNTISIFLPDGTKVAEASAEGAAPKSWKIITMKDNRSVYKDCTFAEEIKMISKYLVDNYYL